MRVLLFTVLSSLLAASSCVADVVMATPGAGDSGVDNRSFTIGWKFTVSTQVTVSGLGFADLTGRGLTLSHMVGIFDANTSELLVSGIVPAGAGVTYRNGFRFVPATYVLKPGAYIMAGQNPANGDPVIVRASKINTQTQISYVEEREVQSEIFTLPSVHFALNEQGAFGPTFMTADVSSANMITGVANSAGGPAGFAPATYVSLFGSGLSDTTRAWSSSDFVNGTGLPVALDGVSVTAGGTAAWVEYVSPGQINVILPASLSLSTGGIPVTVKAPGKSDLTVWIDVRSAAPALFTWLTGTADSGIYVVAQHADYSNVGKTGLYPGKDSGFTTPARPGETIILYGTGFGPTQPAFPATTLTDKIYPLAATPTATIGGKKASVVFAGMVPTLADVYQFNIVVPADAPNADLPLVITTNGISTALGMLTVQK